MTGIAAALCAAAFHFWTPPVERQYSLCFLRRTTGIACPGCGLTRGTAALAKGDWAASIAYHPFAALLAVEAGVLWTLWGLGLTGRRRGVLPTMREGFWMLHAALFVALWAGRMATGTLPP